MTVHTNIEKDKLVIRSGKQYYQQLAKVITEGGELFISDLNAKQAWFIKKRLSQIINKSVIGVPALYKEMSGYYFRVD